LKELPPQKTGLNINDIAGFILFLTDKFRFEGNNLYIKMWYQKVI